LKKFGACYSVDAIIMLTDAQANYISLSIVPKYLTSFISRPQDIFI